MRYSTEVKDNGRLGWERRLCYGKNRVICVSTNLNHLGLGDFVAFLRLEDEEESQLGTIHCHSSYISVMDASATVAGSRHIALNRLPQCLRSQQHLLHGCFIHIDGVAWLVHAVAEVIEQHVLVTMELDHTVPLKILHYSSLRSLHDAILDEETIDLVVRFQ